MRSVYEVGKARSPRSSYFCTALNQNCQVLASNILQEVGDVRRCLQIFKIVAQIIYFSMRCSRIFAEIERNSRLMLSEIGALSRNSQIFLRKIQFEFLQTFLKVGQLSFRNIVEFQFNFILLSN